MKYLIILLIAIIGCDPFSAISTLGGLSSPNPITDAILTDIVIETLVESTNVSERKIITVPGVSIKKFIESQEPWIFNYEHNGGYAFVCNYLHVHIVEDKLHIFFHIKEVDGIRWEWGLYKFPITQKQWDNIRYIFPTKKISKTLVFVSFKD